MADQEFHKMVDHPIIQEKWEPKVGDHFVYIDAAFPFYCCVVSHNHLDKPTNGSCFYCRYNYSTFQKILAFTKSGKKDSLTGRFIWLPRLDQLLKMQLGNKWFFNCLALESALKPLWIVTIYHISGEKFYPESDKPETAMIKAIMHTHGLERVDGEWRKI